jgi:ubiquinol-cytochrome c reductase cytochrome b subunit
MWVGAMPAEEPYATISLIASAYWFAYFLIILPVLGITETPLQPPATIEEDFNSNYPKAATATAENKPKNPHPTAVPAE